MGTVVLGFEDYMRACTTAEPHLSSVPENTACYIDTSGHAEGGHCYGYLALRARFNRADVSVARVVDDDGMTLHAW